MKKVAFVLSGGGAKGCIQVGMLDCLINEKKIIPNIVVGISTGALQSVGLVLDPSVKLLKQLWFNIKSYKDIYTKSFLNYLKCLCGISNGVYTFDGLRKILEKYFDKKKIQKSDIKCFIGKVSLQSGKLIYKDNSNMTIDDIIASCTIPIAFPTVDKEEQYIDGGVRDIVPLKKAIDEGADDIYILLCSPLNSYKKDDKQYKNIIDVTLRTQEILLNEVMRNDIDVALEINAKVKDNHDFEHKFINFTILEPQKHIIDTLEFEHEKIIDGYHYGYNLARRLV